MEHPGCGSNVGLKSVRVFSNRIFLRGVMARQRGVDVKKHPVYLQFSKTSNLLYSNFAFCISLSGFIWLNYLLKMSIYYEFVFPQTFVLKEMLPFLSYVFLMYSCNSLHRLRFTCNSSTRSFKKNISFHPAFLTSFLRLEFRVWKYF